MRKHTKRSDLSGVLVYANETERVSGMLCEHQEFISDGYGGEVPGLKSWDCVLSPTSPLAARSFGGGDEAHLRLDDGREGKVFVRHLTVGRVELQGTGPLARPKST